MMAGSGSFRHRVTLDEPGPAISDPDGGWVPSWIPLTPAAWDCSIEAPTTHLHGLEYLGGGSVVGQATHMLVGRYHPGITLQTRVTFQGRTMNVIYARNRDERDLETVLLCAEVVP